MAERNIKINVKTDTGYDTLYPKTKGSIVDFNKSDSNLGATNVDSAIKEVNTKADSAKSSASSANTNANGRIEKTKILETLNEVNAATQKGFVPDALAIKEFYKDFTEDLSKYYSIAYGWSVNRKSFKRVGNLIFISFTVHPTGSWTCHKQYTVFNSTLPSKYTPQIESISAGLAANGDMTDQALCGFIVEQGTGNIKTTISKEATPGKVTGYFSCNMVYPIKGV